MSSHQEDDTYVKFFLPNRECIPHNLPLVNGQLLDLTAEQVESIEHTLQADLGYKPGLISTIYIPLNKSETSPVNPIQVLENPMNESDALPTNRAIAKIGHIWMYWELFSKAIRTGKYDFFNFQSFCMLPVYIDSNKQPLVKFNTIQSYNSLFNKSYYTKYIPMINYGGDADFTGAWEPSKNVLVYLITGERVSIPHQEIGVTKDSAQRVFDASQHIWQAENEELTDFIISNYSILPDFIRKIIDETLKSENSLKSYKIIRSYYNKNIPDEVYLDEVLDYLKKLVNSEFSKHLSTSQTIVAVDTLSIELKKMYDQALPYYKKYV
jgi:hypothetical protein